MIEFKLVGAKNFYSVGDNGIEICIDDHSYKLITGTNGSGKSVIVCDALFFVLFGKSFRGVKKTEIINTTNKKDCLAWAEFVSGKDHYRVERGIKPNKFNVYKNGESMFEEHSVAEQQKRLEENILGFTSSAFAQTVMLSTTDYTPFMQLPAPKRRELIEQLLDLGVFSDMKENLKARIKTVKSEIDDVQMEIKHSENTYRLTNEHIADLKRQMEKNTQGIDDDISNAQAREKELKEELEQKREKIAERTDGNIDVQAKVRELDEKINDYKSNVRDCNREITTAQREKEWLQDNPNCPTCGNPMDIEKRNSEIEEYNKTIEKNRTRVEQLEKTINSLVPVRDEWEKERVEIRGLEQEARSLEKEVKNETHNIEKLKRRLKESDIDNSEEIDRQKDKLKGVNDKLKNAEKQERQLQKKKQIFDNCYALLGDDGIKSVVVNNYIPLLNQYTNQYLEALNLPLVFSLDSEFNESVRSYLRNDLSYKNLSMGQRQRVDLALIFAWRKIAQAKNSIATNLLIFDELFDSSIDQNGTEDLKSILDLESTENGKMNVIVVSHRPETEEMFEIKISFELEKGFTKKVDVK